MQIIIQNKKHAALQNKVLPKSKYVHYGKIIYGIHSYFCRTSEESSVVLKGGASGVMVPQALSIGAPK